MLTPDQESEFKQLLKEFADLFAKDITQLGRTDLVMHKIYTENIPLLVLDLIQYLLLNKLLLMKKYNEC